MNSSGRGVRRRSKLKEPNVKTQIAPLIAGLSLAVALPLFAQSADAKYCADLKDKFEQYVSDGNEKGSVATSLDVEIAKGKCSSDPGSAIPVFEKALKSHRITLPPRT
jgi:hypothetical protein